MTLRELQNQALKLSVAESLVGIAKTETPPPTDEEAMLNGRLAQNRNINIIKGYD
jgi:hypothetical protein